MFLTALNVTMQWESARVLEAFKCNHKKIRILTTAARDARFAGVDWYCLCDADSMELINDFVWAVGEVQTA